MNAKNLFLPTWVQLGLSYALTLAMMWMAIDAVPEHRGVMLPGAFLAVLFLGNALASMVVATRKLDERVRALEERSSLPRA